MQSEHTPTFAHPIHGLPKIHLIQSGNVMENIDTPNPSYKKLNLLSKSGEFRIMSAFERFKEYIVKHFDANKDDIICNWNKFGATFRYFSDDISLQIKVWQYSNDYLKLPDDIIIITEYETDNTVWEEEKLELYNFLIVTCRPFGFCHIAFENLIDDVIKKEYRIEDTVIPCYRLYSDSN